MPFDQSSDAPDCEIVSTRTVAASNEMVFAAWTNPDLLQNWWGPAGFTNTFEVFDLRPGGKWRFTMHGPDKGTYQNECVFMEITKPMRLAWNRLTKPLFQVVVTFEALGTNKTKIVFRQIFPSVAACNKIKAFAGDKNEENFDRLEAELEKMALAMPSSTYKK
ncbi:MAG: ATPase [Chitinophagaceae bacterium]|nr:MAG: ATPase [Chitinophagaceae bacterium]